MKASGPKLQGKADTNPDRGAFHLSAKQSSRVGRKGLEERFQERKGGKEGKGKTKGEKKENIPL